MGKEGEMDEKKKGGWSEWINAGKLTDFLTGKRQLIIYANTDAPIWHVGVIVKGGEDGEEDNL